MKAIVYDVNGKQAGEVDLPSVFTEPTRIDLIRRAFNAFRTRLLQPKGNYKFAGLETSAEYAGRRHKVYRTSINRGMARLPREKLPEGRWGDVKRVPQAKGGRRAHPPKAIKKIVEKINKKEKRKAIRAAIAATALKEQVEKRGHKVGNVKQLPIIVEDKLAEVKKAKELKNILSKLGLEEDLKKAEEKKIKAGKGKMRGRKYRKKKSVLIVVHEDKGVSKAGNNIPGVDVCIAKDLNINLLAPGGDAGRLTVFTKSALTQLDGLFR